MGSENMKILVFSDSAWDDTNALGNTLSNWFSGDIWKCDSFANIYFRNSFPNNSICNSYFKITIFDMVKHYFKNNKIGVSFKTGNNNIEIISKNNLNFEKKCINLVHKIKSNFIYSIMDYLFRKEKWINTKLINYVKDFNPDIVFAFLTSVSSLNSFVKYIKNNTDSKVVIFIADDMLNIYNNKPKYQKKLLIRDMQNIITNSDKIYAISDKIKEEYMIKYNKNIDILYKGCNFKYDVKNTINNPLEFVYAGNLLYGRDKVLSIIAKSIDKYNTISNKRVAILKIYTSDYIDTSLKKELCIGESSFVMGKKNYDEIQRIMNLADFNIHVESFDKQNIEKVRYSFSTKIIDCLQSGSNFIGIGPDTINSIQYISKIPGVTIINQIDSIEESIFKLVKNKNQIIDNSNKIRTYAKKYHDSNKTQKRIRKEFLKLIENGSE